MLKLAAALLIGIAPVAWSQDHANCPMAPSAEHRAGVDHRHDQVSGVGHESSVHHFLLAKDGGSIRLEVTDAADVAGRGRIREHLQAIARAFGAGDFAMPKRIHAQAPPGSATMAERRAAIRYTYADTDTGGIVTISTEDRAAREAVHQFLRFQISDHGTGDPTE